MSWTWWMTLLVILLALFLLGCIPVGVDAGYEESGYFVKLKVGFLRLTLLPRPQKPKKQKKRSAPKKQPEKSTAEPKKKAAPTLTKPENLLALLHLGCDVLGSFRKKLRVEKLTLQIRFGGDAASAAINYGRAWALIGVLTPLLERFFVIRERQISPELCYETDGMHVQARLVLTITIARALSLALYAGVKFLKFFANNKKGGVNDESSSV